MANFTCNIFINASFSKVWEFYSTIEGLKTITPNWMNLRVESIVGPENNNIEVLEEGSKIELSIKPFGIGFKQEWTSIIVERKIKNDTAFFKDKMENGPFEKWIHTHKFSKTKDGTLMSDQIEFKLVDNIFNKITIPFVLSVLYILFWWRHRKTKKLLE